MRDAPRDVGPGRLALRRLQLRDVVEGDDEAVRPVAAQLRADAHQQRAPAALRPDLHLTDARPLGVLERLGEQGCEVRHDLGQAVTGQAEQVDADQLARRPVRQLDPALRVEPDDAGGHARQHRLGKAPSLVDLAIRIQQLGALRGQLAGHPVEGARQPGDLVLRADLRHPDGEVTRPHPLRRLDQPADRPGDLVCDDEADQHRRHQHQQRDQAEDQHQGDLQAGAVLVEPLVLGDRFLVALHVVEDARIDRPLDHQHQRRQGVDLGQRPHLGVAVVAEHGGVPRARLVDGAGGDRTKAERCHHPRRGDHLVADRLEDDRRVEAAQRRLRRQDLGERVGVAGQDATGVGEVVGHAQRVGADVVAVLLDVALARLQALLKGGAHPVVEPGLHAEIEEYGRKDGDDDRRRHRDDAEQQHQAHMQLRAGRAAAALHPHAGEPAGQHRAEQQQHDEVGEHQAEDEVGTRRDVHAAGQGHEGADAEQQRDRGEQQGRELAEQHVAEPAASTDLAQAGAPRRDDVHRRNRQARTRPRLRPARGRARPNAWRRRLTGKTSGILASWS